MRNQIVDSLIPNSIDKTWPFQAWINNQNKSAVYGLNERQFSANQNKVDPRPDIISLRNFSPPVFRPEPLQSNDQIRSSGKPVFGTKKPSLPFWSDFPIIWTALPSPADLQKIDKSDWSSEIERKLRLESHTLKMENTRLWKQNEQLKD